MKFSVLSENLQKGLSLVSHALSSRNQLPVLSQVLIEAKENLIVLQTTDLEIGIETTIPGQIEKEGGVTVPAKILTELISSISQEKITLEEKERSLEIVGKKNKTTIQIAPRNEFPQLYENLGEKTLTFTKNTFKENLDKVIFAASIESTRPALTGVLIKEEEEKTTFVATDGYRLSVLSLPKEKNKKPLSGSLIVSARHVREAFLLNHEEEIDLFVYGKNNQAVFSQNNTKLIGRLIEAEFPAYEKILPAESSTKISLDREEFLKAVKACAIFARESSNIVTLSLEKEKIVVSGKSPSLGENVIEIESKLVGEENQIAFNARYLLDVLGNLSDTEVVFEMTGPLNAGVFKTPKTPGFLHIIMPIRV